MKLAVVVACTVATSGCDLVWGLTGNLDVPTDGRLADAADASADADATVEVDASLVDDEDGDGSPDSSDLCPGDAFQADTDTDEDGLPDQCDPDKNRSCHHRVAFFTFNDVVPALDAPSPWSYELDSAGRGQLAQTDGTIETIARMPIMESDYSARIRVEMIGASDGSNVRLGVGGEMGGLWCDLVYDDGNAYRSVHSVGSAPSGLAALMTVPVEAVFRVDHDAGFFICSIEADGTLVASAVGLGQETYNRILIGTNAATAKIKWLDITRCVNSI